MKNHQTFYKSKFRANGVQYLGILLVLFGVFSIWNAITRTFGFEYLTLGFWILFPPFWFYIEYLFIFDNWENAKAIEDMKYLQSISAKIWAAIVAVLMLLYLSPIKA